MAKTSVLVTALEQRVVIYPLVRLGSISANITQSVYRINHCLLWIVKQPQRIEASNRLTHTIDVSSARFPT